MNAAKAELLEGQDKLTKAKAEVESGFAEAEANQKTLVENAAKLEEAKKQIADL